MPSSLPFLQSCSSSSSSSSSENDSKSDQSDDDDDDEDIAFDKKRTIARDNDMLERPSDPDDSDSQTDGSDNDEKDLFPSSNNLHSYILPRQATLYDDDWPKKTSLNERSIFEFEPNDTSLYNSSQRRLVSV